MAALSDYIENAIINHILRNQAFTPPTTVYLALFTVVTGLEADLGVTGEVSGGSYARQTCALNAASGGSSANTSEVTFPTATVAWGTVTHWALVDHVSNTNWGTNVNVLMWGALDVSKVVGVGDVAKVSAGALVVTMA
jgi:hypothetical protein